MSIDVWLAVVLVGAVSGVLAAGLHAVSSSPDLDDPHVRPGTIHRFVADHPLARRIARAIPKRTDAALAEAIAVAAIVVTAAAVAVGVALIMIRTNGGLARVDTPLAEWAAEGATDRSSAIMRRLSEFGGTAYIVIGAVAIAVYSWFRDRRWTVVAFVVLVMIGQFLVSNSIKWSTDRARPTLSNLTGFSGTSFPSGHAVAGAAAWACVAFLLGRGRSLRVRAVLFGLAVALGVVVAGTRVALGVHWTTDVITGLVIGWTWFAVCALLFDGRRLRAAQPLEIARSVARRPRAEHRRAGWNEP